MSPTVRNWRPCRSTIDRNEPSPSVTSPVLGSATHALRFAIRRDLLRQTPHALRRQRQFLRVATEQPADRGRDGAADRIACTLAAALRTERADPVAALDEDLVDLLRDVADARHAVLDDIRVRERCPVVDELLRRRRAERHHRGAQVLAVDECRIDRETDVPDRRQLLDRHAARLLVEGRDDAARADLPERRQLVELARLANRADADDLAPGAEPLAD